MDDDVMLILLRNIRYKQQPGWTQVNCPICNQPAWNTGAIEEYAAKLRKSGYVVAVVCDSCSLKRREGQLTLDI